MISSNTYTYKPLERYQIRLLELQPLLTGNADETELSGMILTLSLDEAVALGYQALSCTWGPPKLSEKLEIQRIGGHRSDIYITKQLHSALLHLQRRSDFRRLWIDQICLYVDRYQRKYRRNLRLGPLFSEGFHFMPLGWWLSTGCVMVSRARTLICLLEPERAPKYHYFCHTRRSPLLAPF